MTDESQNKQLNRRTFLGGAAVSTGAIIAAAGLLIDSEHTSENNISAASPEGIPLPPPISALVEESGWIISVVFQGVLGDWGSYALDPDGTPKVVLNSTHAGYTKTEGAAVETLLERKTVATMPLRKPVNPAIRSDPKNPNSKPARIIDERDLGNGLIQVRLALSEWIYSTDRNLTLDVLDGWRSGVGGVTGLPVTNNSKTEAPVPIFRWVLPPYDVTQGAFQLSLLVASHHPQGFDPVAAVRFIITDGSNTRTVWATSLATDNSYGDNLRCHSVIVDPAVVGGFNPGLLRCDAEVYPYLGTMRSTDPSGQRSMSGLNTAAYNAAAQSPWVIGYDPLGNRYSNQFAYIDPVNGSTVPNAKMIAASRQAAKAVSPALRPRDVATAVQAARLTARPLPAANGGLAAINSVDGLVATLAPGTHANALGATAVASNTSNTEIPVVIEGDPEFPNARSACVLQTARSSTTRLSRLRLRRLTIEAGGPVLAANLYTFLDDIEIRGKAGAEMTKTAPVATGRPPAGQWNLCITKSKVWRSAWRLTGGASGPGLVRACEHSTRADGLCMVKNRWIPKAEDGFNAASTAEGYGMWFNSTDIGALEDVILAFNDVRSLEWLSWTPRGIPANLAGTKMPCVRRHVIMGNVFERIKTPSTGFFGYGEGTLLTMCYLILEGNTFVGSGFNAYYSDPSPKTALEADTLFNEAYVIRQANNATDRNASKQDDFNDPNTIKARGGRTANGYRPQMVHAWGPHFGAGLEANYDASRAGTIANYRREFPGLRSVQEPVPTDPKWASDLSIAGTNQGQGRYEPLADSGTLGRVVRANTDVDWSGKPLKPFAASGALQPLEAGV